MEKQLKIKGNEKSQLEGLADRLRSGDQYVYIEKALDDLLGTALPDRDLEIEGAWERSVKGSRVEAVETEGPSVFADKMTKAFSTAVRRAKAGKKPFKESELEGAGAKFFHLVDSFNKGSNNNL